MLDLRRLACFIAVAEELHFHRAAERLHLAQPPLTRHIRALEADMGMRLFERGTRAVRLTLEGESFLPHARRVLQEVQTAEATARKIALGQAGPLSIGYASSIPLSDIFVAALKEHNLRSPGVALTLREIPSAEQVARIREGALDIGFYRPGKAFDAAEIDALPLGPERLVAAVPTGSRFAAIPSLPIAALQFEPFILFPRLYGSGLNERVNSLCSGAGFSPRHGPSALQMTTIVALVGAGLGVSIVPASTATLARPGVTYIGLDDPDATIDLMLIFRRHGRSAAVQSFIDILLAVGGKVGGATAGLGQAASPPS